MGPARGGRDASEPVSSHSLRGSWEHVAWRRARGWAEWQHPFAVGTGRTEASLSPCVPASGNERRKGRHLTGRAGGAELAFMVQIAERGFPVMPRLVIALLQMPEHKLLPSL